MDSIVNMFMEGGYWMYAITALALISHPLSAFGVFYGAKAIGDQRSVVIVMAVALLSLDALSVGLGVTGMMVGQTALEAALATAGSADAEALRAEGERIAQIPLWYGLLASIVPSLSGVFLLIKANSLK